MLCGAGLPSSCLRATLSIFCEFMIAIIALRMLAKTHVSEISMNKRPQSEECHVPGRKVPRSRQRNLANVGSDRNV